MIILHDKNGVDTWTLNATVNKGVTNREGDIVDVASITLKSTIHHNNPIDLDLRELDDLKSWIGELEDLLSSVPDSSEKMESIRAKVSSLVEGSVGSRWK